LTEDEEAEVQEYIKREFGHEDKKSDMSVSVQDIIAHSGRQAPKPITYDKPRYDKSDRNRDNGK
jgi:hypothetical protein